MAPSALRVPGSLEAGEAAKTAQEPCLVHRLGPTSQRESGVQGESFKVEQGHGARPGYRGEGPPTTLSGDLEEGASAGRTARWSSVLWSLRSPQRTGLVRGGQDLRAGRFPGFVKEAATGQGARRWPQADAKHGRLPSLSGLLLFMLGGRKGEMGGDPGTRRETGGLRQQRLGQCFPMGPLWSLRSRVLWDKSQPSPSWVPAALLTAASYDTWI